MYTPVLTMRWYKVQSDVRVDWCSAADAAAAVSARAVVEHELSLNLP